MTGLQACLKKAQAARDQLQQFCAELTELLAHATAGDAMAKPVQPARNETRQYEIRHPNGGIQTVTEIVRTDPHPYDRP